MFIVAKNLCGILDAGIAKIAYFSAICLVFKAIYFIFKAIYEYIRIISD